MENEKKEINDYGELLEFATDKKCLFYKEFGSYQGDYIAILRGEECIEIWKGYYGTCECCDDLERIIRDNDYGPINKNSAIGYVTRKEGIPFSIIPDDSIHILLESNNLKSFFPANTRVDLTSEDLSKIVDLLKECLVKKE